MMVLKVPKCPFPLPYNFMLVTRPGSEARILKRRFAVCFSGALCSPGQKVSECDQEKEAGRLSPTQFSSPEPQLLSSATWHLRAPGWQDGEESQDDDEECTEEDESLGEEGGGRQACVWYEAKAPALWKEESWKKGQEISVHCNLNCFLFGSGMVSQKWGLIYELQIMK